MDPNVATGGVSLPADQAAKIAECCAEFGDAWKAGTPPKLEDYLDRVSRERRADLLRELLVVEWFHRRQRGETPTALEYERRFSNDQVTIAGFLQHMAEAQETVVIQRDPVSTPSESSVSGVMGEVPPPVVGPKPNLGRFGDYELVDEIAQGGMGIVYKAWDANLHRIVALKTIRTGQLAAESEVRRFFTEAQAAASLDHPNIVPIYEVATCEGRHFFTMRFVDGPSLAGKLRNGPFNCHDAARIVAEVADAVDYAHHHGVIHRDLKPGNILLDPDGRACVTDFGLAKQITVESDLTSSGQILGTPNYMPPEQAGGRHDEVGPRSDVYGLGAVLYHLVTGRPPFQAVNPVDVVMQLMSVEPVEPRVLNPAISLDLNTIILKCLEKETYRRYDSAGELAEELRRFMAGQPIHARPVSRPERLWRWAMRNRLLAATAALSVVAVAATFVLFVVLAITQGRAAANLREEQDQTRRAMEEANIERERVTHTLADVQTALGLASDERSEPDQAALWFANAAAIVSNDPQRQSDNRIRVRNWLQNCYIPVRAIEWTPGAATTGPLKMLFAGDRLVAFDPAGACRILDPWSGRETRLAGVTAAAWSHKTRTLAVGNAQGKVDLYRLPSNDPAGSFSHRGRITALAFRDDGAALAVAGESIRLWNCMTKQFEGTPIERSGVGAMAFGPGESSDLLAAFFGSEGRIELAQGKTVRSVSIPSLAAMALSPDGAKLAVAAGREARIYNAATMEPLGRPMLSQDTLLCVAFDAAGKKLATGGAEDLAVWHDGDTGEIIYPTIQHQRAVESIVEWGEHGKYLATAQSGGLIRLWRCPAESAEFWRLPPDRPGRYAFRLAADGMQFVRIARNEGGKNASVTVHSSATGRAISPRLTPSEDLADAALSPDGTKLALAGASGRIEFRDWQTDHSAGRLAVEVGFEPRRIVFRAGWQQMAVAGVGRLALVDLSENPSPVRQVELPKSPAVRTVADVCYSPNGESVIAWGWDDGVYVVDSAKGSLRFPPLRHELPCNDAHVSADSKWLATASDDRSVRVWNLVTGESAMPAIRQPDRILSVRFNPGAKWLATARRNGMWRYYDWRRAALLPPPFPSDADTTALAFHPTNPWIVTLGIDNLRVWELHTSKPVSPQIKLKGRGEAVAIMPDGDYAIALDESGAMMGVHMAGFAPPENVPNDDLVRLCELTAGERIHGNSGVFRLSTEEWLTAWRPFFEKAKYNPLFQPPRP